MPSVLRIVSCSDEEFARLSELHAGYLALERVALAGGPDAEEAHRTLLAAVPRGTVYHFRPNAKGQYNAYRIQMVTREKAADGAERYFVHYTPLYDEASAALYRRLLVGSAEGEEEGWLKPVKKPGYQGERFLKSSS